MDRSNFFGFTEHKDATAITIHIIRLYLQLAFRDEEPHEMKNIAICSLAFAFSLLVFSSISLGQQTAGTKPETGIQNHKTDVIAIQNATVVPEPGKKLEKAFIVIRDGKIVEIGVVKNSARKEIDAADCVVAPGFIDPHTHYDAQIC